MVDMVRLINGLVRSLVIAAMTGTVVYLSVHGEQRAIDALTVQFVSLVAFIFGERAGLKVPGGSPEGK